MHRENDRIGKATRRGLSLAMLVTLPLLLIGCTPPPDAAQLAQLQAMGGQAPGQVPGQPGATATPTGATALNGQQAFNPFPGAPGAGGLADAGKNPSQPGLPPNFKMPPIPKMPPFQFPPFNFGGFGDGPS